MTFNKKIFDIQDLPIAYFNDNIKANNLRMQVIKNQVKISECGQSDLENTFFSDENLDLINKQLILSVFKHTNGQYKIEPQTKQLFGINSFLETRLFWYFVSRCFNGRVPCH